MLLAADIVEPLPETAPTNVPPGAKSPKIRLFEPLAASDVVPAPATTVSWPIVWTVEAPPVNTRLEPGPSAMKPVPDATIVLLPGPVDTTYCPPPVELTTSRLSPPVAAIVLLPTTE